MKSTVRTLGVVLAAYLLVEVGCAPSASPDPSAEDTGSVAAAIRSTRHEASLVQFGTLEQLDVGAFDGPTTVRKVARAGDFGLGTYQALDGEMIVLDGTVYRFTSDGVLAVADPCTLVPFAAVTRFRADKEIGASSLAGYTTLQSFLSEALTDTRRMFAIKAHGTMTSIKTRAPRRQDKPYPPLAEAVLTQAEFTRTNVEGTLVGFRLPTYIGTLNATGYHFHFVSDDHAFGGHVLDVSTAALDFEVQTLEDISIDLALDDG